MNISSNLLTAMVTGSFVFGGALLNGYLLFKKNKNDFSLALSDNWRKDNERLSKRLDETTQENDKLTEKVTALRAERDSIKEERNVARAACEIFRALFDELVAGRPPSRDKLATIKTRLIDVGFFPSS